METLGDARVWAPCEDLEALATEGGITDRVEAHGPPDDAECRSFQGRSV